MQASARLGYRPTGHGVDFGRARPTCLSDLLQLD